MKFSNILQWVIKLAGLAITAPVTVVMSGLLFADVPGPWRTLVQIAAVVLVEGVFLWNWIQLDNDRAAESAYKVQWALTAAGLYIGLWVLAWQHGEGLAGIVFRLALGAALLGSVGAAGVYDILRATRSADRDILRTPRVRRSARKLDRSDAILSLELDSEYEQARAQFEHDVRMAELQAARATMLENVQRGAVPSAQPELKLLRSDAQNGQRSTGSTRKKRARKLSKDEAKDVLVDALKEDPNVQKVDLAERIGRVRNTVYSYLQELADEGILVEDPAVGSGYQVANGHREALPG